MRYKMNVRMRKVECSNLAKEILDPNVGWIVDVIDSKTLEKLAYV